MADIKRVFLSESALKAPHEGHGYPLCELVKTMTREQYKELVRNAQYLCQHCGRTAASSENLCFPETL